MTAIRFRLLMDVILLLAVVVLVWGPQQEIN